jgi:hypothetical protein
MHARQLIEPRSSTTVASAHRVASAKKNSIAVLSPRSDIKALQVNGLQGLCFDAFKLRAVNRAHFTLQRVRET